jgi:hypothetical protein
LTVIESCAICGHIDHHAVSVAMLVDLGFRRDTRRPNSAVPIEIRPMDMVSTRSQKPDCAVSAALANEAHER